MEQLYQDVEKFFHLSDIPFTLRGLFYLCSVEERQFYYSPQTGKWRMKGKSRWFTSSTPFDFLVQARQYCPPNYQEKYRSSQKSQSQKNQQQKKRQSKQKDYSRYSYNYHSHSYNYHSYSHNYHSYSTSSSKHSQRPDGLSAEFIEFFEQCLLEQRIKGYKIGWIWHTLLKSYRPSAIEICWLSVVFDYSPGWAYHQIKDFFGDIDYQIITNVIQDNRNLWLHYFQHHWGSHKHYHSHQREHQHQRQHQQKHEPYSSKPQNNFPYQHYLDALNLSFPITLEQLKRAYRQKAKETHPDLGGSAEAFRLVNTAYSVLSQVI